MLVKTYLYRVLICGPFEVLLQTHLGFITLQAKTLNLVYSVAQFNIFLA